MRRCFKRNDSEPRKSHENSTKSPRKVHERATNSKNSGSLARPWTVVQDLRILGNFGHQTCARGAKNTRRHDASPARLAVQTRLQSNQLVKRAVFTRDLFSCSAGRPFRKPFTTGHRTDHITWWMLPALLEDGLDRPKNRHGRDGSSWFLQHFHILDYRGGGWSQSLPLNCFFSCSLGGGGRQKSIF